MLTIECNLLNQHPVIALGVFDGVHVGHQKIISTARQAANSMNVPAVAITFDPHPRTVVCKNAPDLLLPLGERCRMLKLGGAYAVGVITFDDKLAKLPGYDFLEELMHQYPFSGIVVGRHWRFGCGGSGEYELIADFAKKHKIFFAAPDEITLDGETVSSSAIRALTAEGNFERAELMLGRKCRIFGKVVSGYGDASKILKTPTANLSVDYGVLPPDGIYAAAVLADDGKDGRKRIPAAVNIGFSPTFESCRSNHCRRVEVHLIGFNGMLYSSDREVEFIKFLRQEQRFNSADDLAKQISIDIQQTLEVFKKL
jgi:riboflavin kinase/FMN adenylyltransferase